MKKLEEYTPTQISIVCEGTKMREADKDDPSEWLICSEKEWLENADSNFKSYIRNEIKPIWVKCSEGHPVYSYWCQKDGEYTGLSRFDRNILEQFLDTYYSPGVPREVCRFNLIDVD